MDKIAFILASFFYVGRIPKAPGTFGSIVALPLAWWVWKLESHFAWAIIIALFLLGIWASNRVIKMTGKEDHQVIVLDEVVGILVTTSVAAHLWWHYALAFFFFRAFDIFKPGPIGWLDARIKGGMGAMIDDLAAAIFATLTLYLVFYFTSPLSGPALA